MVRAEASVGERAVLLEASIPAAGPARLQVNRQPVRRRSDLADALNVTVFAPDDLDLVQGGPVGRREYLDDVLVARHARLDALVTRLEALGATRVQEFDKGPAGHWWIMRDPEGNEFCAA